MMLRACDDGWLGWAGLGNKRPANVDFKVDVKPGAQPAGNLCRVARRSGSVIEFPTNRTGAQAGREGQLKWKALGRVLHVCMYRDEWALSLEWIRVESSRSNSNQFNSSKSYLAVGRHG